jgi:hypothetical protein
LACVTIPVLFMSHNVNYNECSYYYKSRDCASYLRKDFYLHGQSRSTVMEINVTSKFEIVLNGGRDYIVTCCTEPGFYPIHYTIESKETGEMLYDNMQDNYLNSIGFSIDNTQTVIISVTLLAEGKEPSDFEENRSCVGVSVQFKKTPRLGF